MFFLSIYQKVFLKISDHRRDKLLKYFFESGLKSQAALRDKSLMKMVKLIFVLKTVFGFFNKVLPSVAK